MIARTDDPRTSAVLYRDQGRSFPRIDRAEGVYLWDRDGKRYLDGLGGVGVVTIGHGVPEILEAVRAQWDKAAFVYGGSFTSEAQIELAEHLVGMAPDGMTKAFFVSGGSEATESALKIARQYWMAHGRPEKHKVVARWGGYHGNTMGALSMSGRVSWRELYEPYLSTAMHHIAAPIPSRCSLCDGGGCSLACADELEALILREGSETVSAFIAEPYMGSAVAGIRTPDGYFARVREICDRHDVLLIVDEVFTGFGRTGRNFAIDHWGVTPDIIATAKGIASGYAPLGGVIVRENVADALYADQAVIRAFTYAGAPLSCAIGLAVQRYMVDHELTARSVSMGAYLHERAQTLRELPYVGDVRGGDGLLLGVDLVADAATGVSYPRAAKFGEALNAAARDVGVTLYVATGGPRGGDGDSFMLAPPYVITHAQVDELIDLVTAALERAYRESGLG